jgi:hypothetical protein
VLLFKFKIFLSACCFCPGYHHLLCYECLSLPTVLLCRSAGSLPTLARQHGSTGVLSPLNSPRHGSPGSTHLVLSAAGLGTGAGTGNSGSGGTASSLGGGGVGGGSGYGAKGPARRFAELLKVEEIAQVRFNKGRDLRCVDIHWV